MSQSDKQVVKIAYPTRAVDDSRYLIIEAFYLS